MAKVEQTRTVPQRVHVGYECDVCRKQGDRQADGWCHFHSGHSDWGNDSIESQENWDVCSWKCYLAKVRELVDDYGRSPSPTLEVDWKDLGFLNQMLEAHNA